MNSCSPNKVNGQACSLHDSECWAGTRFFYGNGSLDQKNNNPVCVEQINEFGALPLLTENLTISEPPNLLTQVSGQHKIRQLSDFVGQVISIKLQTTSNKLQTKPQKTLPKTVFYLYLLKRLEVRSNARYTFYLLQIIFFLPCAETLTPTQSLLSQLTNKYFRNVSPIFFCFSKLRKIFGQLIFFFPYETVKSSSSCL